ncbi:MAG: hypothetical protein WBO70_02700 [Erysipelotrichaceae bacterium]
MEDNTQVTQVTGTDTATTNEDKSGTQKTFTQEDLDKLAGKVRNEEKAKNEQSIQNAIQTAIAEYERQAKLTAEEKEKEARSKKEKEILDR